MKPRPYQQEAIDGIHEQFKDNSSTLLVLATGLGKTICFCSLAGEYMEHGRVMILAHRAELVYQAQEKLSMVTGIDADIEMGDQHTSDWFKSGCVISTIQTQIAGMAGKGRMTKFDPSEFSILVIDECFPAWTLIDGVKIEKRRKGDLIRSFNHVTNRIEYKEITHIFKRKTEKIVEIKLSTNKKIVCTENHPIFTLHGYVPAIKLKPCDMVLNVMYTGDFNNGSQFEVQSLRRKVSKQRQKKKNMLSGMPKKGHFPEDGQDKSETCFCENEKEQSDAQARNQGESIYDIASYRMEAPGTGRKRKRPDCSAKTTCMCSGVGNGNCSANKEKRGRVSNMLQVGYWTSRLKDWCRGRRGKPQGACTKKTGRKENPTFVFVGVESVTVHEQGSSGRFRELCPRGTVYNLEVRDNNNYFVEDTLVHNCHHAAARSYVKVIDYYRQGNPDIKILGVTATPDRKDEKALGKIFETVAYEYGIRQGITGGWLVPIEQRAVEVEGLDYSSIRTKAGDLNGADLKEVMEYEENLQGIAVPTVELTGDRKTLIFAASVPQAERLSEIINRYKQDSARFVCGTTDKMLRRNMFMDYAEKRFQYLVNVGVATEGFDDPGIECVVMARPTKSRSLYAQMAGRGTRVLPGIVDGVDEAAVRRVLIANSGKPTVEIIDFVGNAGKHRLITTADILGGDYSDDVVDLAKKNVEKKNNPADMLTELDLAEKQLLKEQREDTERGRRSRVKARAKYSTAKINPFDTFDIMPHRERAWHKGRVPSLAQINMLDKCGVDAGGLSFTHADQLISKIVENRNNQIATYKQIKLLQRYRNFMECEPSELTFKEAGSLISAIADNKWQFPHDWDKEAC